MCYIFLGRWQQRGLKYNIKKFRGRQRGGLPSFCHFCLVGICIVHKYFSCLCGLHVTFPISTSYHNNLLDSTAFRMLYKKRGQAVGLPLFIYTSQIVPLTISVAVPGVMAQVPSALCV